MNSPESHVHPNITLLFLVLTVAHIRTLASMRTLWSYIIELWSWQSRGTMSGVGDDVSAQLPVCPSSAGIWDLPGVTLEYFPKAPSTHKNYDSGFLQKDLVFWFGSSTPYLRPWTLWGYVVPGHNHKGNFEARLLR